MRKASCLGASGVSMGNSSSTPEYSGRKPPTTHHHSHSGYNSPAQPSTVGGYGQVPILACSQHPVYLQQPEWRRAAQNLVQSIAWKDLADNNHML